MLVVGRKVGEVVICQFGGLTMEVSVKEVRNGRIILGFDGPKEIRILRREIVNAQVKK